VDFDSAAGSYRLTSGGSYQLLLLQSQPQETSRSESRRRPAIRNRVQVRCRPAGSCRCRPSDCPCSRWRTRDFSRGWSAGSGRHAAVPD
jgi:hypothetical protein